MNKLKNIILASPTLFLAAVVVYAAAPVGGYLPNATNNPDCAPGDTDCFVQASVDTNPWFGDDDDAVATDNTEDIYVLGKVGIGATTTPSGALDVRGQYGSDAGSHINVGQAGQAGRINFGRGNDGAYSAYVGFAEANDSTNFNIYNQSGGSETNIVTNSITGGFNIKSIGLGSSTHMTVRNSGNVGIGTTTPVSQLHVENIDTTTGGITQNALNLILNSTGNKTKALGLDARVRTDPANGNDISTVVASHGRVFHEGSGTISVGSGAAGNTFNRGTGTIALANALAGTLQNTSTGTINEANGLWLSLANTSTGTIDQVTGLKVLSVTNAAGGTVTDAYGVYVGSFAGAFVNNPYSFYASDVNALNYFGGNVGIGTTNPDSKLSVVGLPSGTGAAAAGVDSTLSGAVCIMADGDMFVDTDGVCSN